MIGGEEARKVELLVRIIISNYLISERNMAKESSDQEFLEYLVKALVDNPGDVKIDRKVDEMGVLLSLKVNPEDMGQIIGKAGATARSIRSLVRIVGLKNHARVNLKIEEPEGGRVAPRERRAPVGESELEDLKL
jgi:predicted RNA-binding protein YlqC (UPF0109 family)